MGIIYVGTSGFSYKDWVEAFYPPELPKRRWLEYYARHFKACELNFTYYRLPEKDLMRRLGHSVPADFIFTVKVYKGLTHQRPASERDFAVFLKGLEPLLAEEKLGCLLAQFPYSFAPSTENRRYLEFLAEQFASVPLVVEFRNARWLTEETFAFLRENNVGFCCVDEPPLRGLLPPIARATADIAYVRFHGRNKEKWWNHEEAWERYDYIYSREELEEWIPRVRRLADRTVRVFLFANNHWKGQAVGTAQLLRDILSEEGFTVL